MEAENLLRVEVIKALVGTAGELSRSTCDKIADDDDVADGGG